QLQVRRAASHGEGVGHERRRGSGAVRRRCRGRDVLVCVLEHHRARTETEAPGSGQEDDGGERAERRPYRPRRSRERGWLVGVHAGRRRRAAGEDRKSTRLNSSHVSISYAVFCLKKKKTS